MKQLFRRISCVLAAVSTVLFGIIGYWDSALPDRYQVDDGKILRLSQSFLTTDLPSDFSAVSANSRQQSREINLLGLFPVKQVSVESSEPISLVPSGSPFGVKMFTRGAMIVGMSDIPTDSGNSCPGRQSGLQEGDIILSINHQEISRNEEATEIIENSQGNPLVFSIQRGDTTKEVTLQPVLSSLDHHYKTGLWIRDSAAGIGTITYVDPATGIFGGLGHAICDVDTGEVLPVGSGDICDVSIHRIHKGEKGNPGELQGVFASTEPFGNILENNATGIYGQLFQRPNSKDAVLMAHKQEVEQGPATILCMLEDGTPKEYDIEILSINYQEDAMVKNMVIQVTDEELLELTGGIVQGMSGTPILQNGKLVGAVTHVFINDPQKGYGIFAENMYQTSSKLG